MFVPHSGARGEGFNLQSAIRELGMESATTVLLNWYRFDRIDRIALVDLSLYFVDIWYPGSDDIEIFDESCSWVLAVSHTGELRLTILDAP